MRGVCAVSAVAHLSGPHHTLAPVALYVADVAARQSIGVASTKDERWRAMRGLRTLMAGAACATIGVASVSTAAQASPQSHASFLKHKGGKTYDLCLGNSLTEPFPYTCGYELVYYHKTKTWEIPSRGESGTYKELHVKTGLGKLIDWQAIDPTNGTAYEGYKFPKTKGSWGYGEFDSGGVVVNQWYAEEVTF